MHASSCRLTLRTSGRGDRYGQTLSGAEAWKTKCESHTSACTPPGATVRCHETSSIGIGRMLSTVERLHYDSSAIGNANRCRRNGIDAALHRLADRPLQRRRIARSGDGVYQSRWRDLQGQTVGCANAGWKVDRSYTHHWYPGPLTGKGLSSSNTAASGEVSR